jgi:hypothetical protein
LGYLFSFLIVLAVSDGLDFGFDVFDVLGDGLG